MWTRPVHDPKTADRGTVDIPRRRSRRWPIGAFVGLPLVLLVLLAAVFAPQVSRYDPQRQDLERALRGPSRVHPLGTDEFGRDLLARIIYGSRLTLLVGVGAVTVGGFVGISVGAAAGYYRGIADAILMRALDITMAFPSMLLALAVISLIGAGVVNLILAVGVYAVPIFARITRSVVLSLREQEYVDASRAIGCGDFRILTRHILPNASYAVIVTTTITMATSILTAASLSFLGIGIPPGVPEWGAMVSAGRAYMIVAPHLIIFPGAAIALLTIGLNLLGDALRDRFDPRVIYARS